MSATWHWQTDSDHPYLRTSLLERWPHGFFTRRSWPSAPDTLSEQFSAAAAVYRAKQVHGNRVLAPDDFAERPSGETTSSLPEADAIMTSKAQQAVWVCTADCTPVLIADENTGRVAAVHAGWRGTALRIVPKTIQRLVQQGSNVKDLRVAMGPAIAGNAYQVTTHVAAEVGRSLHIEATDDELLTHLQDIDEPPVLPDPEPGRVRLDVRRVNKLQLVQMGLTADRIAIAPHCTYQEPEHYFSYRRSREKKVQWSGIVSY